MIDSKGEIVTDFYDSVGTSSVSYSYSNAQTSMAFRNESDVSITVTINGNATVVTRFSTTTLTAEFSSFSVQSASGNAAFYVRTIRGVPTNNISATTLNVVSGSATTPSISPIADSNTGIFFPASETVAISTNGTEAIRINSSSQLITTAGSAATPAISPTGDTNTGIAFPSADTIVFSTAGSERMRVKLNGYVGIGDTDPSYKLDVASYAATPLRTLRSGEYGEVIKIGRTGVAGTAGVSYPADNVMSLTTNDVERMRIGSNGIVGIGTSNPSGYKLQVNESVTTADAGNILGLTTTSGGVFQVGVTDRSAADPTWSVTTGTGEPLQFIQGSNNRLYISSGGNVGIGTTSPVVYAGYTNVAINGTTGGNLDLMANGVVVGGISGDSVLYLTANAGYPLVFGSAGASRGRFDTNGYLLVGYTTSNGAYKLQVNSQIFATSATVATSDARYKENVTPLNDALSTVMALNPVQFEWKEHPIHEFDRSQPTVGFLAQEVQQVLADKPYLNSIVKKNECEFEKDGEVVKEEFLGIAEGNMIAILTKAIQELKAEVDSLKAQLASN